MLRIFGNLDLSKCVVMILNEEKKIIYNEISLQCSDMIELYRQFVNLSPSRVFLEWRTPTSNVALDDNS